MRHLLSKVAALLILVFSAGCEMSLLKKNPTLGIVEVLAKAQATPTPQVVACKVIYPDGTEKDAVCPSPTPEVKQ